MAPSRYFVMCCHVFNSNRWEKVAITQKQVLHILSVLGRLGDGMRGLRPDSIMAQMSCKESAPPTDDMLAINCTLDASRSDERRLDDVAASAAKRNTIAPDSFGQDLGIKLWLRQRFCSLQWPWADCFLECVQSKKLFATFAAVVQCLAFLIFVGKFSYHSTGRKSFTFQDFDPNFIFRTQSIFNSKK